MDVRYLACPDCNVASLARVQKKQLDFKLRNYATTQLRNYATTQLRNYRRTSRGDLPVHFR